MQPDVKTVDINKDEVRAQMDGSVVTDFESKITIDKEETTDFIEDSAIVNGATSNSTYSVSTYVENSVGIKEFLKRPILLHNAQWTTGGGPNTTLHTSDIAQFLTSEPMWANKVSGFNLIRGDFMIKVVLNASPFQQGRLLLHYLPNYQNFVAINPEYGKFKSTTLVQKLQHPHVEIDARTTSVVMRIPYIAPTAWYAIKEQYYDWGRYWLDVFSPLQTGPSAPVGQEYVDYSVYGWWENVELNANTVPQSSKKVIVRGGAVTEKEAQGPIEAGLRRVGKVATIAEGIPLVSSYASTLSWASNIAANVASVFGWSKPPEHDGQTNVYKQTLRYAGTCDGPNTAFPGGITTLNRLETIDYGSFTNEDEMSLAYLYSVPYYAGVFNWAVGDGPGTSCYSHKLSPTSILTTGTDTVAGHTVTYENHVPFTYMAKFHNYWRGSLKVTLKFIKTQMHSGRLQITWTPINDALVTPSLATSSYSKRAIVDIRTEDSVTFELPYLLFSDYAPTSATNYEETTSGQLDIQILNDLRAPESVAQNINVLMFIGAGDDYELVAPSIATSSPVPYVPQSSSAVLVRDAEKQGVSMASMEIGGVNTKKDPLFHAKRCIGEKVMSIKSYLLRNSVLQGPVGSAYTIIGQSYVTMDPWYMTTQNLGVTGLQKTAYVCGDALSLIGLMYAYQRGSINLTLNELTPAKRIVSTVVPRQEVLFTTQPIGGQAATNNATWGNSIALTGEVNYFPLQPGIIADDNGIAYQNLPYYNKFPFSLNTYYNSVDDLSTDYSRSITCAQFYLSGGPTANSTLMRSVGDDYQLMFFTGAPCLVRNYV